MRVLRTLFLSPWMSYHRIASWKEGVVEAVTGKVDVLEEYDAECASPSVVVQIPAVVRIRKEIRRNQKAVRYSRRNVYLRDGFRCCYCGDRFPERKLNLDHVMPASRGGVTSFENIVSSCAPCNSAKDARTPGEAGMRMHFKPRVPRVLPTTSPFLLAVDEIPEQWKPYIHASSFGVRAA
jgi:5-methylcytosine-specific restriction endonuclease McrA